VGLTRRPACREARAADPDSDVLGLFANGDMSTHCCDGYNAGGRPRILRGVGQALLCAVRRDQYGQRAEHLPVQLVAGGTVPVRSRDSHGAVGRSRSMLEMHSNRRAIGGARGASARDLVREIARLACDRRSVRDLRAAGRASASARSSPPSFRRSQSPTLEPRPRSRICLDFSRGEDVTPEKRGAQVRTDRVVRQPPPSPRARLPAFIAARQRRPRLVHRLAASSPLRDPAPDAALTRPGRPRGRCRRRDQRRSELRRGTSPQGVEDQPPASIPARSVPPAPVCTGSPRRACSRS